MREPIEPAASRPTMPGYGLLPPEAGRGLLPWAWAEDRLRGSHNYWLATVRLTGPHLVAVWGVWSTGRLWFSTGKLSRKARNLADNSSCVVATERADEAVIVEGLAESIDDQGAIDRIVLAYEEKYAMGFPPHDPVFAVRPTLAFGFVEHTDEFAGAATRWSFHV